MDMTAGERIRQLRRSLGLTQANFASRIGVSTSYIAAIELKDKKINIRIFRLISAAFEASETWLQTGEGGMYEDNNKMNEIKILGHFRSLNIGLQECAINLVASLAVYQELSEEKKTQ